MRIYANQLPGHLRKALLPAYLVTGDETLLVMEATDAVRERARHEGFSERQVFEANGDSDWDALLTAGRSMSLFAQRQILEVRLRKDKTDDTAQRALLEYLRAPSPDHLLLISAPKLDKGVSKQKWFTTLIECGAVVSVTALKNQELPAWIQARARGAGLQLDAGAVALVAERNEGNLLAVAQEIDKLSLLLGAGPVGAQQVAQAVADGARYHVFEVVDACLQGDRRRVLRMFSGLQAEGVAPAQILWWLTKDLRVLAMMALAVSQGKPVEQAIADYHIWDTRKPLFRKALAPPLRQRWQQLLAGCADLDRRAKGFDTGNLWADLLDLGLRMA